MSFRALQDLANATLLSDVAFGEAIVYTAEGGSPTTTVYAAPAEEVTIGPGDIPIATTRVVLRLRASDLSGGPQARASLLWRGVSYRVESVDGPDDGGMATLTLMRLPNMFRVIGTASETDTAILRSPNKVGVIGTSDETDTAEAIA